MPIIFARLLCCTSIALHCDVWDGASQRTCCFDYYPGSKRRVLHNSSMKQADCCVRQRHRQYVDGNSAIRRRQFGIGIGNGIRNTAKASATATRQRQRQHVNGIGNTSTWQRQQIRIWMVRMTSNGEASRIEGNDGTTTVFRRR